MENHNPMKCNLKPCNVDIFLYHINTDKDQAEDKYCDCFSDIAQFLKYMYR